MIVETTEQFATKKSAMDAGLRSRKSWYAKFFVPRRGEQPTIVKGEEFFAEYQLEEVYSISKGTREIGPLRLGAQPVGKKRFRSVRYVVYRESDFIFQPKAVVNRKIDPARRVDLLDAIAKIKSTAAKFEQASLAAKARKDHKRSRGFKKRMNNLLELAELGIRRAINEERIRFAKTKRGKKFRYDGEGYQFDSKVAPPEWMIKEKPATYSVHRKGIRFDRPTKPKCRLMDAVYTIEQFQGDPTLDW